MMTSIVFKSSPVCPIEFQLLNIDIQTLNKIRANGVGLRKEVTLDDKSEIDEKNDVFLDWRFAAFGG
jgi:hypothetical protein